MTDKRMHKIQELKKHRIRARRIHIALAVFGVFAVIILGVKAVSFFRGLTAAVVELSVQNTEIVQGEAMPPFLADVKLVRKGGKVLDKDSKYTAADFVADLKSGKGYTLSCKGECGGVLSDQGCAGGVGREKDREGLEKAAELYGEERAFCREECSRHMGGRQV